MLSPVVLAAGCGCCRDLGLFSGSPITPKSMASFKNIKGGLIPLRLLSAINNWICFFRLSVCSADWSKLFDLVNPVPPVLFLVNCPRGGCIIQPSWDKVRRGSGRRPRRRMRDDDEDISSSPGCGVGRVMIAPSAESKDLLRRGGKPLLDTSTESRDLLRLGGKVRVDLIGGGDAALNLAFSLEASAICANLSASVSSRRTDVFCSL